MARTRWIWVAAIVAALLVGGLIGARWRSSTTPVPPAAERSPAAQPAPPPSPAQPETPFLQIEGTNLSGTDAQGVRLWDIRAKTLAVDRSRQQIVMTSVTGQFYRAGKPEVVFSAPNATFNANSRDVELTGGVVGRTVDGRTLRAGRLRYQAATRTVAATGGIVLVQKGLSIRADALTADPGLNQTTFTGNIVVQVTE